MASAAVVYVDGREIPFIRCPHKTSISWNPAGNVAGVKGRVIELYIVGSICDTVGVVTFKCC